MENKRRQGDVVKWKIRISLFRYSTQIVCMYISIDNDTKTELDGGDLQTRRRNICFLSQEHFLFRSMYRTKKM